MRHFSRALATEALGGLAIGRSGTRGTVLPGPGPHTGPSNLDLDACRLNVPSNHFTPISYHCLMKWCHQSGSKAEAATIKSANDQRTNAHCEMAQP